MLASIEFSSSSSTLTSIVSKIGNRFPIKMDQIEYFIERFGFAVMIVDSQQTGASGDEEKK